MFMNQEGGSSKNKGRSWLYWLRIKAKNGIRYGAMAVVIISVWHFFAPFIPIPVWPAYESLVPTELIVVGQPQGAIINATHLLPMVIGGIVIWKL